MQPGLRRLLYSSHLCANELFEDFGRRRRSPSDDGDTVFFVHADDVAEDASANR